MSKKYLVQVKDVDGCDVLLGEEEWKNHILDRHPEIEEFLDEIIVAIKNPHLHNIDPEVERVYLHYYKISRRRQLHKNLKYLLIVIKYVNAPERNFARTGFVSSVYFIKNIKKRGKQL